MFYFRCKILTNLNITTNNVLIETYRSAYGAVYVGAVYA